MAFQQSITGGFLYPVFVNEGGNAQSITGDIFVNESGFPPKGVRPRLLKRKRHAAPLKRRAYGNVAATIPVVATFTGYARPRIQKRRRRKYRPARHLTPSPFIPVVPPPTPVGGHFYPQGWIKRHEKPDTAKEIRDLIDEIVYGKPALEEVVEAVSVPVLVREVEQRLIIPRIDVAGVVAQIMAVLAEHQRIQDENDDDDSFMLMGDL